MKAKYPNITVLATQYDNDSSATAASQVEADITAHPNLSGGFATNVLSAQGRGHRDTARGRGGSREGGHFRRRAAADHRAQVEHHPASPSRRAPTWRARMASSRR